MQYSVAVTTSDSTVNYWQKKKLYQNIIINIFKKTKYLNIKIVLNDIPVLKAP